MRIYQYKITLGSWSKIISFGKYAGRNAIIDKINKLYPAMRINDPQDYDIYLYNEETL